MLRCMPNRTTTRVFFCLLVTMGGTTAARAADTDETSETSSDESARAVESTDPSTPSNATPPSELPINGDAETDDSTSSPDEARNEASSTPSPSSIDDITGGSNDRPPSQVRRAVQQVVTTAREVAADDPSVREASARTPSGPERREPSTSEMDDATASASSDSPPSPLDGSLESFVEEGKRALFAPVGETLDVTPHVSHPKWKEAMQLLVDDECREALPKARDALEASDRSEELRNIPAVRYAVARIRMCAGHSTRGRRTMRQLAQRDDVVAEMAARRLGDSPSAPDSRSPELARHLREARQLAQQGDVDRAFGLLEELRTSSDRSWFQYKTRKAQGEILVEANRLGEATRVFSGLYRMTHGWRVGDDVAERIEELETRKDLDIVSVAERIDRIRELIDRGDYYEAKQLSIETADIAGVSGDEVDGWSFFRRGLQAEAKRRREKAVDLFEKAEERVESSIIRPRLYYGWARALRRLDRDDRAIELYARLCREFPTQHLCDDARFHTGRLHQFHNDHAAAREAFIELVGLHPSSSHVDEALWRGGFNTYLAGQYDAVDRPLAELAERFGDREDTAGLPLELKADYWRAMAALRRDDTSVAAERFQEVINEGALTWYGHLAASRLESMGRTPVIALPDSELTRRQIEDLGSLEIPAHEALKLPVAYARIGLYEDAIDLMNKRLEADTTPEGSHRLLASLRLKNDDPFRAQAFMRNHIEGNSTPSYFNLREWGLAYPLDYMPLAHKYGKQYDVSPYLLQAIMQRESGFRPEVDSYAGAIGLMQLMPGTANVVSQNYLEEGWVGRDDLQEPDTNVRFGTIFTRAVLEFSRDSVPLALASYNAGPGAMRSWFERFGDRQIDAWAESLTYEQTRGYVRKVMTSYVRYRALYSSSMPRATFDLPDNLRSWNDIPKIFKPEDDAEQEAVSSIVPSERYSTTSRPPQRSLSSDHHRLERPSVRMATSSYLLFL